VQGRGEEQIGQRMVLWQERTEELAVALVKERYLFEEELIRAMLASPAVGLEAARGCGITLRSFEWEDMAIFFAAMERVQVKERMDVLLEAALEFERRGMWLEEKRDYATRKRTRRRIVTFSRKYLYWLEKEGDAGIVAWVRCWAGRLTRVQERMNAARLLLARLRVVLKGNRATRAELLAAEGKEVEGEQLREWSGNQRVVVMEVAAPKGVPHSGHLSLLARRS